MGGWNCYAVKLKLSEFGDIPRHGDGSLPQWFTDINIHPTLCLNYNDVVDWLSDRSANFRYAEYLNWPGILAEVLRRERPVIGPALFMPSGQLWTFTIVPTE